MLLSGCSPSPCCWVLGEGSRPGFPQTSPHSALPQVDEESLR